MTTRYHTETVEAMLGELEKVIKEWEIKGWTLSRSEPGKTYIVQMVGRKLTFIKPTVDGED
jgi:hypothetical protein